MMSLPVCAMDHVDSALPVLVSMLQIQSLPFSLNQLGLELINHGPDNLRVTENQSACMPQHLNRSSVDSWEAAGVNR